MRLAFDLHGVLKPNKTVTDPRVIKLMTRLLKSFTRIDGDNDLDVYVMTGSTQKRAKNELIELGLYYRVDDIFSITDYRQAQDPLQVEWVNHAPRIEDVTVWDSTKAELCQKLEIDYLFDDVFEYSKYFIPYAIDGNDPYLTEFIHVINDFEKMKEKIFSFLKNIGHESDIKRYNLDKIS